MKRKGKILRNILLAVVLLLLAVIGFMIFSIRNRQELTPVPAETVVEATETVAVEENTEPAVVEVTMPVAREYRVVEVADGTIETPYGNLYYPQGLSDHLLVVCTSEGCKKSSEAFKGRKKEPYLHARRSVLPLLRYKRNHNILCTFRS